MIAFLFAALAVSGNPALVLKGLDPIDLANGKETPGLADFAASYGRHTYRFSTPEHLKQFQANPRRYAVQTGGACGKMGALTGKGSPDRWAVVDGKIFLFASDGCRTTFLARKEAYFLPLESAPKSTPEDRKRAKSLFDQMVAAHGGAKAFAALKGIEWTYEIPYQENGKPKIWQTKWGYWGPERFAQWEKWDAGISYFAKDGKRTAEGKPDDDFPIHPDELREFTAKIARSPVGILMGGGGQPVKPLADGQGFVMVRGDIVSSVILDPTTSRIAAVQFRDRYAGPVASVRVEYGDYANVQGVWLPKTQRAKVDDGAWSKPATIASFAVGTAMLRF